MLRRTGLSSIDRFSAPESIFIKLNTLSSHTTEKHRSDTSVTDGQCLLQTLRIINFTDNWDGGSVTIAPIAVRA